MKKNIICLILLFCNYNILAQTETEQEQQLENLAMMDETETEDDANWQYLQQLLKVPLNINTVGEEDLSLFNFLTPLQIQYFLKYRQLLGNFISIYELQAVPGWDVGTIKKILPYIIVAEENSGWKNIGQRLSSGTHTILLRAAQVLEKSKGYTVTGPGNYYMGTPQKLLLRYKYAWGNLLQYGITADKDAGEQFFKGAQKSGFDFYTAHLFLRNLGKIKAIALGDFTVNMGQGLVQWQSLAFKKSAGVVNVKRQSPVLRPYNSAGEFNFNRGAGITLAAHQNIDITAFFSYKKISGNLVVTDTLITEPVISSMLSSGYHRTPTEVADRYNTAHTSYGGAVRYKKHLFQMGINGVGYHFSLPFQKADRVYNYFSIQGSSWYNISADYSYTLKNMHFFGETATSRNGGIAVVQGLQVSTDKNIEMSVLYRKIPARYQSLLGNAFTENSLPANETGLYAGVNYRLPFRLQLSAYADWYRFPWLKYLADAPSQGRDYMVQVLYKPNKIYEASLRYRNEVRQQNAAAVPGALHILTGVSRQNFRWQAQYRINRSVQLRNRAELVWYSKETIRERGYSVFVDYVYKPMMRPLSVTMRGQYFNTDGYNSRIYAFENDVLYSYTIPVVYNKGFRYYLLCNVDITSKLTIWLRWAQTIYQNQSVIGSGLDAIPGNKKSDIRVQLQWAL